MSWPLVIAGLGLVISAAHGRDIQDFCGSNVKLDCQFEGIEDLASVEVQWTLRNETTLVKILYFQEELRFVKDRVIWEGDVRKGDASIRITDLQPEDEGNYSCEVLSITRSEWKLNNKTVIRLTLHEPNSTFAETCGNGGSSQATWTTLVAVAVIAAVIIVCFKKKFSCA